MNNVRLGRFMIVCLTIQALMSPTDVVAGFLTETDYVYESIVQTRMDDRGNSYQVYPVPITGIGQLSASDSRSDLFGSETARAATGGIAAGLLHSYASYDALGGASGTSSRNASGLASHRDVTYVNGAGTLPDSIRLQFHVDGKFFASIYPTTADPIVHLYMDVVGRSSTYGGGTGSNFAGEVDFGGGVSGSWDSARFDKTNSGFEGTFHIDSNYDANLGGYGWSVSLQSFANGAFSTGTTDFFNTTGLTAVTLLDGTPIDGVTFDSGLSFQGNAVPEPSSLCLAMIGSLMGGLWWLRSSKATPKMALPLPSDI